MDTGELIELVRSVISQELEVPLDELKNQRSLRADYGLDSVAAVNIVFSLETKLGITIDMRDLVAVDSIDDIRRMLEEKQSR